MRFFRLKYLIIIIPVLAVVGTVIGFVVWSNVPRHGVISNAPPAKSPTAYFDKTVDGTYMKFQYNSKYVLKKEIPINGDLERYTMSAGTRYDKRLLAVVANLPDSKLETYGAYIYRKTRTDLYAARKLQSGDEVYTVWVRSDGTEQTAMIPQGNKVAVITYVTANPKDDLTSEMDAFLNSYEWK